MPDYALILRRSISALPDPTPDMREAVYQRARAALARQLTAVDPPLSSREIEAQHQELEDAVVRLEAEFAPAQPAAPSFEPPKEEFDFTPTPAPAPMPEAAPPPPPRPQPPLDERIDVGVGDFEPDDDEDDEFGDDEDRGSRWPALVGLLVVVLVVVGIGWFAYSQRGAVLGLVGLGGDDDAGSQVSVVTEESADDSDKQTDRLTNGSGEAPEPTDTVTLLPGDGMDDASVDATVPQDTTDDAAALQDLASLGQDDPGTSLVAQRAIYYYQGAEGQAGEAIEGSAAWANVTKDGNPAIQVTLGIAQRNVDVTVTIYKNYDDSLPASHLVEIEFSGALSESPIQRVPALVLKQTEQARGQPLAGAAVPVTNELFWIALSDDSEQVARNVQLLREGSWFDVPILFSDQTRALLTFEKGIPGDRVFETVMASWNP